MLQVFLAANAKKEGVVTLGSDLQYKVLKSGAKDAPSPDEDTACDCHYTGTLITGETFDSTVASRTGNQPNSPRIRCSTCRTHLFYVRRWAPFRPPACVLPTFSRAVYARACMRHTCMTTVFACLLAVLP